MKIHLLIETMSSMIKDFIEGTLGVKEVFEKQGKEKSIKLHMHKNVAPKKISIYHDRITCIMLRHIKNINFLPQKY